MKAADIVFTVLQAAGGVTNIVADRIYPIDAPLDVDLPVCYYEVTLNDAVDGSAPMSGAQVQVGCVAHSEETAHSLASEVHAALSGLTYNSGGTWLRSVRLAGRTEQRDAENNLWGVLLAYRASVTF